MRLPAFNIARKIETTEIKRTADYYNAESVATRSSGLHYFITTLLLEKIASALDAFTVTPLAKTADDSCNAHIIELPPLDAQAHLGASLNTSDCFILKHAKFIERHLRVDEFFAPSSAANGQHPFPYCHYTETYEAPDGKRIILHLYINKEGKIEHCQIKIVQTTEDADGNPIETVSYFPDQVVKLLKPLAAKNADIALKLIKKLNVQKLDKFLSLHKEIQDLDCQLSRLSMSLHKKKSRTEYLTLGKKFIESIKILNSLTDSRYADTRDVSITRMCTRIQAGDFNPKTFEPTKAIEKTREVDSQAEPTAEPASEEAVLAASAEKLQDAKNNFKLKINGQRSKLSDIIQKDKEQLDRFPKEDMMDAKQLIERAKIIDNLRCNLLDLYCLPDNPQKELAAIEVLEKELDKIPTLLESFEACAKLGKLAKVTALYQHVENHLSVSFINELIEDVLYNSKDNLDSRVAVCNYLHENSALYRITIQIFNCTFTIKNGLGFSSLVAAASRQNKSVFDMLLRQGANPNEAGLIYGERVISPLYAILIQYHKERYHYVEKLLQYDSLLEFPSNYFEHLGALPSSRTRDSSHSKYSLIINETLKQIKISDHFDQKLHEELIDTLSKGTSALFATCKLEPTPELINLLAPKSGLDSVLCSLALLALQRAEVRTRFLPASTQAGLHFYATQAECDDSTMLCSKVNNNTTTSMFLFYIIEEGKIHSEYTQIIKSLVEIFNEKYTKILAEDPKQLQKLKDTLIHQAATTSDYDEKKILYTACFYLQACNPNPTVAHKEEMLQTCAYTAKMCLNTTKQTEWRFAQVRCTWAVNMINAINPEYRTRLKSTPIFTFVAKQLEKANKRLGTSPDFLMITQARNQAPITQIVRTLPQKSKNKSKQ